MDYHQKTRQLLRSLHIPVNPTGGETPDFIDAIKHFQAREGIPTTGLWDRTLMRRLQQRVAKQSASTVAEKP